MNPGDAASSAGDALGAAFRFRSMTQADAEAIALWHYPEPFSFYDSTADPDDLAELLDPARRSGAYAAVDEEVGDLVGFFSFKRSDHGAIQIGLGLRPDRTGRGLGGGFVRAGLEYAHSRFDATELVLSVASFNRRAITVYERAGFVASRSFVHSTNGGEWEFVEMRRPV